MDVREKLVELLRNAKAAMKAENLSCDIARNMFVVDFLMASGVTVQEWKPLEEFLHPIDVYKGLKAKYLVFKADTGKVVDNCFILRPDKDAAAVEALRAYANATDNKTLAEDIYSWVGKGEPVQEWISVKDRLPDDNERVIAYRPNEPETSAYKYCVMWGWSVKTSLKHRGITHWCAMPQPPKGE